MRGKFTDEQLKELIGKKFGRLTVVEYLGRNERSQIIYKCKCDCGNFKTVVKTLLENGQVKSCGCLLTESRKERGKVMGQYTRKHEEICDYCGKPEHYAKGLCKNCYSRVDQTGEIDKTKRIREENQIAKEQRKLEKERARIERYNPISKRGKEFKELYLSGYNTQEIADMHGVTRQRICQILSQTTYGRKSKDEK